LHLESEWQNTSQEVGEGSTCMHTAIHQRVVNKGRTTPSPQQGNPVMRIIPHLELRYTVINYWMLYGSQ